MTLRRRQLRLVLVGLVLVLAIAGPAVGRADNIQFTPEVPIPGVFTGTQEVNNNFIGTYIRAIFIYFIWVVGILATAMIVFGGIKWVAAAGNPGRINDARETINNAMIGLVIALTSVLILNVINPNFTRLGLPDIASVGKKYFEGVYAPTVCGKSLSISCNQISKIEGGAGVEVYCMGAKCSSSTEVCALVNFTRQSDGRSSFRPGAGCIKETEVVYKPSDGSEQPLSWKDNNNTVSSIAKMPFNDYTLNGVNKCGMAVWTTGGANQGPSINITCPADQGNCYMIGAKAEFPVNPITLAPLNNPTTGTAAGNFGCSEK